MIAPYIPCRREGSGVDAHLNAALAAKCCGTTPPVAAPASAPRRGDGSRGEAELYAALDADGYMDFRFATDGGGYLRMSSYYVRQYPWGAYLETPRGWRADAGFPVARVLCELKGMAHAVKRQVRADIERERAATLAGWKVIAFTKEELHDGTALAAIRRALDATAREGRG